MNVRRTIAPTMRSALEAVRKEHGPDVLILSDRKVDGGIELITAAGDIDPEVLAKLSPRPTPPRPAPASETLAEEKPAAAPDVLWTHPSTLAQVQRELGALKGLLEQQLSSFAWHDFRGRHPLRARVIRALSRLGLAPALSRDVAARVDESLPFVDAWTRALAMLSQALQVSEDPLAHGGVAAFVGATGVGKTTLLSKLATRHALRFGTEAVTLISADEQRLGAHQQVNTFGRLLGIDVRTARDAPALAQMLAERAPRRTESRLTLIDLPGGLTAESAMLDLGCPLYWVVSGTTDYAALVKERRSLANIRFAGCCITKLDEAASLGAVLSILHESQLPLAYSSEGQRIPDDNLLISIDALISRAIALSRGAPALSSTARLEQAFAG